MLTVSLHGIHINATRGLYAEEKTLINEFLVDVDVYVPATDTNVLPFVDYSIIRQIVAKAFEQPHDLLEHFIRDIHHDLMQKFQEAEKVRITIKKLNPPMAGEVDSAIVSYEG